MLQRMTLFNWSKGSSLNVIDTHVMCGTRAVRICHKVIADFRIIVNYSQKV